MNSCKETMPGSPHGYNQVDETVRESLYHQKSRRKIIIIVSSTILLIGIVITLAVNLSTSKSNQTNTNSISTTIRSVCAVTMYPETCFSSLSSAGNRIQGDAMDLFPLSLQVAIDELRKLSSFPAKLAATVSDRRLRLALNDCEELLEDSIDLLNTSLSLMIAGSVTLEKARFDDLRTFLSAAVTYQDTCLDGFEGTSGDVNGQMESAMKNSTEFTSITLSIATAITQIIKSFSINLHRRLLQAGDFPTWVTSKDRKLLQNSKFIPDLIVAKDGTGNFSSVAEAVAVVPKKSGKRFVIYIKKGTYVENVEVDKKSWNVMMVGDGRRSTIISGNLNFVDGIQTFKTATFIARGKGFIAKDIGFKNTAGPEKHQAVAARSSADMSVFYRCDFDAYQDTLYAHSQRQFYRDCTISGTVDFIFGNAAVVFQNCDIMARQPLDSQKNTITAQGKAQWNQTSGILIQGCRITATGNLTAKTYLGRPWKPYSTTVISESTIGGLIDPEGWLSWSGDPAESPPATIYYAEYLNKGPGASVDKRVRWEGYKPSISAADAKKFSVDSFIQGNQWLPGTGVPFSAGF